MTRRGRPKTGRQAVTVVYIAGDARCGSTLLDLILGGIPGFVSVGELSYIWERGLLKNELCGCGRSLQDCPFWQRVGLEAFGGWQNVDLNALLKLERRVTRLRRWPFLLSRRLQRHSFARAAKEYAATMEQIYNAVAVVSGCPIVVDSSKSPSLAVLLGLMPSVTRRIVHMVRDSRGVAYSWTKQVRRPGGAQPYMPIFPPWYSSIVWAAKNLQHTIMKDLGIPHLFLRYESLVISPKQELERLLDYVGAGERRRARAPLDGSVITLTTNHTVSGNPMRFRRGRVPLRLDDEWRHAMSLRNRVLVSVLTSPLLLLYGYFGDGF